MIGPGPAGPGQATGLWHGPLSGEPAKLDGTVPDTNLAFAPEGTRLALAVQEEAGSTVIVADPAAAAGELAALPAAGLRRAGGLDRGRADRAGR